MDAHEKNQYLAGMLNVIQNEQEALVELSNMEKQGEKWQVTQTHPNPRHGMRLKRMQDWEWKRQAKLYSLRLFCIMVSLTAQNTIRMFSVSYTRKACKREERKGGRERNNTSGTGRYKMRQTMPGDM